jgi:hypothetical protein
VIQLTLNAEVKLLVDSMKNGTSPSERFEEIRRIEARNNEVSEFVKSIADDPLDKMYSNQYLRQLNATLLRRGYLYVNPL